MKIFKFSLAMTAATIMSSAPLARAAEQVQFKNRMNEAIKESGLNNPNKTFNDMWKQQAGLFDPETQQILGRWMANNGNQKIPHMQATSFVDKNGVEEVRLVFSKTGKPQTLSFKSNQPDAFQWNGVTLNVSDARNIKIAFAKLAEKDPDLKKVIQQINNEKTQTNPRGHGAFLKSEDLMKLKPAQRLEYMQKVREALAPAEQILRWKSEATQANHVRPEQTLYSILFAGVPAWAAAPRDGQSCVVAGMVSIYEGGVCKAIPSDRALETHASSLKPLQDQYKSFHQQCTSGTNIACNPLLYGFNKGGKPYCLNSNDQPRFTNSATEQCNRLSPLNGTDTINAKGVREISSERRQSYRDILQSYAEQAKTETGLKPPGACFTEDNFVKAECVEDLKPHLDAAYSVINDANMACSTLTRADQKAACQKLKERALGIVQYIELCQNPPPKPPPISGADRCKGDGMRWHEDDNACYCIEAGRSAELIPVKNGPAVYSCPLPDIILQGPGPAPKEDKCDKDGDGKKDDKSFRCNKGLWIAGILGAGLVLWLLLRKPNKKPKPPGTTNPTVTTVTVPPTTTVPGSEGGDGDNGGDNGGVRGGRN